MAWVAVIGAVGTVAGGALAAHSQSQSSKKALSARQGASGKALQQLDGLNLGHVPDAALYNPVDFSREQMNAITANRDSLPFIQDLTRGTNKFITEDALKRAGSLIPGYQQSMANLGRSANSLTAGQLPFDALEQIIGSRGAGSNSLNVPGLAGPATLKDLGLSSLDAINQGTGLLGKMTQMAEQISPRASYMNPQSQFTNPGDRIRNTMEQNGLIQQSQQNANNLAGTADPKELMKAQLILGNTLGNVPDQSPSPWGGMGAQLGAQLGGIVQNGYNSYTGASGAHQGYDASTGMYRNQAAADNVYATPGYTPIYDTSNTGQKYFSYYKPVKA